MATAKIGRSMQGQVSKGVKEATEHTEDFTGSLKRLATAYLGFEALKAGAEKLHEYVMGAIEGVSATKILAERVGMSTEAFGRLSYAAKLAHTDQDSLAISLEQMNKRLGEIALEGKGPAADALKRFGLTAQQLTSIGTEAAFFKIVQALEQVKNPAERAKDAVDLFGKSGQGMINLVARGSEELKGLGDDASRLGIALSSIDAAKVEEADQAFIKLSAAAQGFANLVVTQLSPFIVEAIDRYIEWGYQGTKSASSIAQGMGWIVSGVGLVVDAVNVLKAAWYGVESAVTGMFVAFAGGIDQMLKGVETLIEKFTGQKVALTDFFKTWSEDLERLTKQQIAASKEAFGKVGQGAETVRKVVDDIQRGAATRAGVEVGKAALFNAPGAIGAKEEKTKFGGALELGSKEAYSSIVRNTTGAALQTEQRQIAANTARSAGAQERSEALLRQIAGLGGVAERRPLTPRRAGAF